MFVPKFPMNIVTDLAYPTPICKNLSVILVTIIANLCFTFLLIYALAYQIIIDTISEMMNSNLDKTTCC